MNDAKSIILQKSLELFSEKGYQATRTDEIVAAAGVSKGLVFYHFKNKEGLLRAIIEEAEQKTAEILNPQMMEGKAPKQILKILIDRYARSLMENFDFWRLYASLLLQPQLNEKVCSNINQFFEDYLLLLEKLFKEMKYKNYKDQAASFELFRKGMYLGYVIERDATELKKAIRLMKALFCK